MNVGIITIHNHHNYGAMLQAFALNYAVRQLGHQCQTIDCAIDAGGGRQVKWSKHLGAQITGMYNACRFNANRRHDKRFRNFGKQNIPLTGHSYECLEQLVEDPPYFDAYITGSDQVWRPSLLSRNIGDVFHLCFVSPELSKLISYAPSFGVTHIPEHYRERIGRYLKRYHALSVREKRGQKIIFELTGRKASQVLDPTLLLSSEEYNRILLHPSISDPYILVYPMELGNDMAFLKLVKAVKKKLRLPVVCVFPLNYDFRWLLVADKIILDAGPSEFLGLFRNASFICTNSFHGTAFSILFKKNFLGVPHSSSNSRIHTLLELTGLLGRQLKDIKTQVIEDVLTSRIDYGTVEPKLQASIDHSRSFLKRAIVA